MTPRRTAARFAPLLLLVLAGCGGGTESDGPETFEVDLAAVPENGPIVSLNGWDGPANAVTPRGKTAVVKVPNGERGNRVAVDVKFRLAGDFEATGEYADLKLPEVKGGYGTGVGVQLNRDDGRYRMLFVGRVRMPSPGMSSFPDAWKVVRLEQKPGESGHHEHFFYPAGGTAGAVRLVREGELMRCFVRDAPDGPETELPTIEFGAEPVRRVALGVDTGGPVDQPVIATLTRLAISADSLPVGPPPPPAPIVSPAWIAMGIAVLAFVGAGIVLWRRSAG